MSPANEDEYALLVILRLKKIRNLIDGHFSNWIIGR